MTFKNYYKILNVSETASSSEIKQSYRKFARKYHPDKNSNVGTEDKFREISEAYEILKNRKKRQEHDQSLTNKRNTHQHRDYKDKNSSNSKQTKGFRAHNNQQNTRNKDNVFKFKQRSLKIWTIVASTLLGLTLCAVLVYWLYAVITSWSSYTSPYREVAWFYNFIIVNFLQGLNDVFISLLYNNITNYKVVNILIGIPLALIGSILYVIFVITVLPITASQLKSKDSKCSRGEYGFLVFLLMVGIFILPLIFIVLWAVFQAIFG